MFRVEDVQDTLEKAWVKWETDYRLPVKRSSMVGDGIMSTTAKGQATLWTILESGFKPGWAGTEAYELPRSRFKYTYTNTEEVN
jgi:hypothetical protein